MFWATDHSFLRNKGLLIMEMHLTHFVVARLVYFRMGLLYCIFKIIQALKYLLRYLVFLLFLFFYK